MEPSTTAGETLSNNDVITSLWSPTAVEKCRIGLADVIVFEGGRPVRYYVTGSTGEVKLKRNFDIPSISKRWVAIAEQLECSYVAVIRQEGGILKYLTLDAWLSFVEDMKPDPAIQSIHTFLSSSQNLIYRNTYTMNLANGRWKTKTQTYSIPNSDSLHVSFDSSLALNDSRAAPINKVVDLATTTVARYVERMLKVTFLEFSVDYVIDKKSQIWMLWSTKANFTRETAHSNDGPHSPQSTHHFDDMDATAKTIPNDDELAAGLSQQFYEMTLNMPRTATASKQLNTLVSTTQFTSGRPDSPSAQVASSSGKFPQPFTCKGDYCNLDISTMGKLTIDTQHAAQHVASKLFTEEEITRLRKDPKFNKMMEFNSSGVGLAEISMRSISLARKEQRGQASGAMKSADQHEGRIHAWRDTTQDGTKLADGMNTSSPTKDSAQGGSFLDRMAAPKKYNVRPCHNGLPCLSLALCLCRLSHTSSVLMAVYVCIGLSGR